MLIFSALKSWSPNLKRVKFSLCFRDLNLLRMIWDFVMWTRRQVVRWLARQKRDIKVLKQSQKSNRSCFHHFWTNANLDSDLQRKPLLWFFCIVCVIFYRWLYLNCCLVRDTLGKWCKWCKCIFQKRDFGLASPAPQHFVQSFPSGEPLTRLFEPRPPVASSKGETPWHLVQRWHPSTEAVTSALGIWVRWVFHWFQMVIGCHWLWLVIYGHLSWSHMVPCLRQCLGL